VGEGTRLELESGSLAVWQSGSLHGIQQLLEKLLLMYCTADMSALGIMFNDWWCVKNNVFV
jgi:hypothetical protein